MYTTGDHIHTLNQHLRNHVRVDGAVDQGGRYSVAVYKQQVAVGAQSAQVELVRQRPLFPGAG